MKFLIIDDCDFKVNSISEFFSNHKLDRAKSYNSGIKKVASNSYHGIILDMQFPTFDEKMWDIDKENGIMILEYLNTIGINVPVMIYSSSLEDVSEYKNVISYVLSDSCMLKDKFEKFIQKCE